MIRHSYGAAVLVSALALAGLAGCGSNSTSGTPSTAAGGHGGDANAPAQDQVLKYAKCMRQHGVNMPDPGPSGGMVQPGGPDNDSKVQAASKACKQYEPAAPANPNDPAAFDRELKMAQCMRRHGIDVQDPQQGQPMKIKIRQGDQAKLSQAQEACRKELGDHPPLGKG